MTSSIPHDDPYARPVAGPTNAPAATPVGARALRSSRGTGARPTPVAILAILFAALALFALLGSFALLGTGFDFSDDVAEGDDVAADGDGDGAWDVSALAKALLFGLLVLVAAGAAFAVAYGLSAGHRWAWFAALGLAALAGAAGLIALLGGSVVSALLALAVAGVVAALLLTPVVRDWYGVAGATGGRVGRAA